MSNLVEIAAQIVAAHATQTKLSTEELISELDKIHAVLKSIQAGQPKDGEPEAKPALTVKEAFRKNEVVCMICGKGGFKTLTRHITTAHEMKPGAYKKQFGIPAKQPLSSKAYSESRKRLALDRSLADNLAKARAVKKNNLAAKKAAAAKPAKATSAAKPAKAAPKPKASAEAKAAII